MSYSKYYSSNFNNSNQTEPAKSSAAFGASLKSPIKLSEGKKPKNSLDFNSLKYPMDISSEELGHYIVFYLISNSHGSVVNADKEMASRVGLAEKEAVLYDDATEKTKYNVKDFRKNNDNDEGFKYQSSLKPENSILSSVPTHTITTGAITLYMPQNVSVNYGMAYGVEGTELSGQIVSTINKARKQSGMAAFKTIAGGVVAGAIDKTAQIVGDALGSSGLDVGNPQKILSKALGVALNPHEEQFFEKPNFRSFSYTFDFFPRNAREAKEVHNILWMFKYHQHPSLDGGPGGFSGRYFKVPSEFEIFYYYKNDVNDFMNKISRCVLESLDIQYSADGQFSTFDETRFDSGDMTVKGAPMTHIKATLKFNETTYLTKQQIAKGY